MEIEKRNSKIGKEDYKESDGYYIQIDGDFIRHHVPPKKMSIIDEEGKKITEINVCFGKAFINPNSKPIVSIVYDKQL